MWEQRRALAQHAQFSIDTGIQVYCCDPRAAWQRDGWGCGAGLVWIASTGSDRHHTEVQPLRCAYGHRWYVVLLEVPGDVTDSHSGEGRRAITGTTGWSNARERQTNTEGRTRPSQKTLPCPPTGADTDGVPPIAIEASRVPAWVNGLTRIAAVEQPNRARVAVRSRGAAS